MSKARATEGEVLRIEESLRCGVRKERLSRSEWRKIYETFVAGGTSARRYSSETGVSYQQLLYWSRKFCSEANEGSGAGSCEFREVGILIRREYRVRLRNGQELIFQSGSDSAEVAKLAAALDGVSA